MSFPIDNASISKCYCYVNIFLFFLDIFSEKFFLHYIAKIKKILASGRTAGRQAGRQDARPLQAKLTIIVSKSSTINISFNLYIVLNSYKSYIVASLFVLSTDVPAVTAGQPDGDLDGGGYRNIPVNVVLLYPKKLSFYPRK